MKWLLPLVLVLTTTSGLASAKIMIMEPPLVRSCPRPKSWTDLTACLDKHGMASRLERTVGKAKLLRLDLKSGTARTNVGLALYIEDKKGLHLAGLYDAESDDASSRSFVLAAEEVTVRGHTGIRIDLGEERPSSVSVDTVSAHPAVQLVHRSLYCSGVSWECSDIITSCDVLVDGRTYWTFRGAVTIADNMIVVAGNRDVAGGCSSAPKQFLGWPVKSP